MAEPLSRAEVTDQLRALGVREGCSRDIVRVAHEHLERDPLLFLHPPSAGCADCDGARGTVR